MDKIVRQSLLFDFYSALLTGHQREVYGEYIQNDLSLTELASVRGISRQGAHDMVRRCEKIMEDYENRLHLLEHYENIKDLVKKIRCCAEAMEDGQSADFRNQKIREIMEISDEILEQY